MKKLLAMILWLPMLCAAQVTVKVNTPTSGASVTSPAAISATATSPNPITGWHIYVDNTDVFSALNEASITANVGLVAGSHTVVVRAWDSTGDSGSETISVKSVPVSTPTPTPSLSFVNIQQSTGWETCGSCGDSGGGGVLATFSMTRGITNPSESGSSSEFSIGGTHPYADAYWFVEHPVENKGFKTLSYAFDIFIPSGQGSPQAIEWEVQQRLGGYTYNFGWQALYAGNVWRIFNYTTKQWESTGIPLKEFTPNVWHHIVSEYHNDPTTHTVFHDALIIDGVRVPVNVTHKATPGAGANEFTNAFQLDLNSKPTPFKIFVDKMDISIVLY